MEKELLNTSICSLNKFIENSSVNITLNDWSAVAATITFCATAAIIFGMRTYAGSLHR